MSLPVLLFSPASLIKQSIFSYESFRLSLFPFVTAFISSLSMVFIFSIRASPPKALTAAAFFSNNGGKLLEKYSAASQGYPLQRNSSTLFLLNKSSLFLQNVRIFFET